MKIGVVGLGYIGLVTAAVLAETGNNIVGVDIDRNRVEMLSEGKVPIYEPELEEVLNVNVERLKFSGEYSSLKDCEAIFVCVPTPTKDGKIDLSYVIDASSRISNINSTVTIIIKSTVVPGTARTILKGTKMNVISNPEFTSEGAAIEDTRHPNRIVIGGHNTVIAQEIWKFTGAPMVITTNENAELIKYASNAFLATKISFINDVANLCEKIPGTDVEVVAKGMGYDKRIAPYFLKAGLGFGGSCFPKDTEALASFAKSKGVSLNVTDAAIRTNNDRVGHVLRLVIDILGDPKGRVVSVLGLSFKDNTDDIRESKAITLVEKLLQLGSSVRTYDPKVRYRIPGNRSCVSIEECIQGADVVIVSTEWEEFKIIESQKLLVPVIDAKRVLNGKQLDRYYGVGINDRKN